MLAQVKFSIVYNNKDEYVFSNKASTDRQNIYRIDAHWLMESSQKNETFILNRVQENVILRGTDERTDICTYKEVLLKIGKELNL